MTTQEFIADLNARYFNGELSESFTSRLEHMPEGRQDVREFVERMFMLMQRGGLPANDISSLQGDILGSLPASARPRLRERSTTFQSSSSSGLWRWCLWLKGTTGTRSVRLS